ncbi:NAD(P)/FAD-dependent oxidoreductase [Nonomuraea sp. FMUSA5-5]|uniref:NAD(P)/FAD-dependent oxidoreductase n=1 Tax=Nonomuraea composti TaxID=2720023 RepID=A0ABX1BEQ0_9ACTN|nr:NAD(P)/FAD-dependent oxidoreductase [Nonomuraea sp. FMUSA5-5]NJP94246.1 NAD(P)/FAD-dependent oxidoreductase [Nonomuraea sp. FMUSA5-5]
MTEASIETGSSFDAVVIGAGFSGMYMLHRLRGLDLTARLYEAGDGVGGTWYWNRYPGARCDVESVEYCYSFSEELQQAWDWTERYPSQPEILRYAEHVADRFDLRRDMRFGRRVNRAAYDAAGARWRVETDRGDRVTGRFLITAVGCLSDARVPDLPGTFEGESYHTGRWPHEEVDFTGKRVAVIGTGSSGIQIIPVIAERAAQVTVFQRTPNFTIPAWNRPMRPQYARWVKDNFAEMRRSMRESLFGIAAPFNTRSALAASERERAEELEARWAHGGPGFLGAFGDTAVDERANEVVAEFVREKIRRAVDDPQVAELLSPRDHPIGTKRPCFDTGYYATYNRPNVRLVDVRATPIEELVPAGLRTTEATYEVDVIVYATGYDAMTGPLLAIDITGAGGVTLRDKWAGGPRTYLGLMTAGFPNLFTITGPGSPSVLSNMFVSIEQHVDWIADCLRHLAEAGATVIEANADAEDGWMRHVGEVAAQTLFPRADSWYMGANIPGKPRVFMPYAGGVGTYRALCDEIAAKGYEGFTLSP